MQIFFAGMLDALDPSLLVNKSTIFVISLILTASNSIPLYETKNLF